MYKLEIPAATYAVFSTPQVLEDDFVDSINGTWTYILSQWFPNSQYEIDEDKFDFEHYDEHCHPWEYDKVHFLLLFLFYSTLICLNYYNFMV